MKKVKATIQQQGIWFQCNKLSSSIYYNQATSYKFSGDLKYDVFEDALVDIIRANEILRTNFVLEGKDIFQVIKEDFDISEYIETCDLRHIEDTEDKVQKAKEIEKATAEYNFDLEKDTLLKVKILLLEDDEFVLVFLRNHIIFDVQSYVIFLKNIINIYNNKCNQIDVQFKPSLQYELYSKEQQIYRQSEAFGTSLEFWRKSLEGYTETPSYVNTRSLQDEHFEIDSVHFDLPKSITNKIFLFALKKKVLKSSIYNLAYNIVLCKYFGINDTIIGNVYGNRRLNGVDFSKSLGLYANILMFRNQLDEGELLSDELMKVNQSLLKAYENGTINNEDIQRELQLSSSIVKYALNIFKDPDTSLNLEGLTPQYWHELEIGLNHFSQFDLSFNFHEKADSIQLRTLYKKSIFTREQVVLLQKGFVELVELILSDSDKIISNIELLFEKERHRLLEQFNQTEKALEQTISISDQIEQKVIESPNAVALSTANRKISYNDLNINANKIAHTLRNSQVEFNSVVGILMERIPEMIYGIIGVLKAGGTYTPLEINHPQSRIEKLIKLSGIHHLITTKQQLIQYADIIVQNEHIKYIYCVDADDCTIDLNEHQNIFYKSYINEQSPENLGLEISLNSIAYVMYTSGSTGMPKGVVVKQETVVNILEWINAKFNVTTEDKLLFVTSIGFDLSVYDMFGTFIKGSELRIVSNDELLEPETLCDIITNEGITIWNSAPPVLQRLIPFLKSEKYQLDASDLRLVMLSGDWIPIQMPEELKSESPKIEVVSLGGATENTIWSHYYVIDEVAEEWKSIPYGKPIQNVKCYILDDNLRLCPIGTQGNMYIGGNCLALGYYNNPEVTSQKFIPNPYNPNEIIYNTGDQARWFSDGNVEFLGRNDNQVKIRGHRIELGEIKNQLVKHPKVKDAVVKDFGEKHEKYINAYYVPQGNIEPEELLDYLASHLPSYMVPRQILTLPKIPLTVNGKIDFKSLPKSDGNNIKVVKPTSKIEEDILEIFSEVLNQSDISVNSDFFAIGGHSLKAVDLLVRLNTAYQVELKIRDIFNTPTVRELSRLVTDASKKSTNKIVKAAEKAYYNVTSSQRRMYVMCQFENVAQTYNIPQTLLINGKINLKLLESSLRTLIQRHEPLRTSFEIIDETPIQIIHESIDFNIDVIKIEESQLERYVNGSIRKFDLSKPGLFRARLFILSENRNVLFFDFHHIIMDGVSLAVFYRELNALYNGSSLDPVEIQSKDYSEWQFNQKLENNFEEQKQYWLEKFSGKIEPLNLPLDDTRPPIYNFEGTTYAFELKGELYDRIKLHVKENSLTLFTFLIGAFGILLSKYSRSSDIIVGTVNANRSHSDITNALGLFMNLLPLRLLPEENKRIYDYFVELQDDVLNAFDNQEYSLEDLIEQLDIQHDLSRNPLFDVLFVLQNTDALELSLLGAEAQKLNFKGAYSRYDLSLVAEEAQDKLKFYFEYNTSLFSKTTIQNISELYLRILDQCTDAYDNEIEDIELLSTENRDALIDTFNNTSTAYSDQSLIHTVFETTAANNPTKIAVYTDTDHISYGDLNRKANQLARHILTYKLPEESIVAVRMDRSIEMMVSILGILKAGCAYLPIGMDYPSNRIKTVLEKSQAEFIIVDDKAFSINEITCLALSEVNLEEYSDENLNIEISPNRLAYVIFTSGSTGVPKGVMIEHTSVINRIQWMQNSYPLNSYDVILQKTTYTFDVSVWELFWWMFSNSSLSLLPVDGEKDPSVIIDAIEKFQVSTMHFVPSMLQIFLRYVEDYGQADKLKSLRYVFASGEALKVSQVHKFQELFDGQSIQLVNLYGPTEATVDVSYFNCPSNEKIRKVPIGKPIDNIQLYILDSKARILPIGVPGELGISGVGVARGYINAEELTKEKFIANPYKQGERIYKTGDLARWLPDGNIEFLGRLTHDSQVKIRGLRIELGEIENNLLDIDFVRNVAVAAMGSDSYSKQLVAYIVPNESVQERMTLVQKVIEEANEAKIQFKKYPNGMNLLYLNQTETDFMYQEIVENNEYLRHGITLPEEACIFDIGANIGMFSRYVSHLYAKATIYAFEPIPQIFEVLKQNSRLASHSIKPINAGIGHQDETISFTYYPNNTILSSSYGNIEEESHVVQTFINNTNTHGLSDQQVKNLVQSELISEQVNCNIRRLSDIIDENAIEHIHLVKIDVEKGELGVINGIDDNHWNIIDQFIMEVHDVEDRLENITKLLKDKNYHVVTEQAKELIGTNLYNLYARKVGLVYPENNEVHPGSLEINDLGDVSKRALSQLKKSLPEYMHPKHFVVLDELPMLSNGKTDRKSLPEPTFEKPEYIPPRNETDAKLTNIWLEILGISGDQLSIELDFFKVGGNSLNATLMLLMVNQEFKISVPLITFYKAPNIQSLSDYITATIRKNNLEDSEFKTIEI